MPGISGAHSPISPVDSTIPSEGLNVPGHDVQPSEAVPPSSSNLPAGADKGAASSAVKNDGTTTTPPVVGGKPGAEKPLPEGTDPALKPSGKPKPDGTEGAGEVAKPVKPVKPEPPSYVNRTEADLEGVPGFLGGSKSAPVLPLPVVDTAKMMMTLSTLQQRMADESLKLGEEALKDARKDLEDLNKRRAAELENYWNNMEKSRTRKSMGLFGVIANFFKQLFTGDVAGAFKTLADNIGPALSDIGKLIGSALSIVFAAGLTAISGGAGSVALGLAIAGMVAVVSGMVMGDPGIQDMIMQSLPESERPKAMWAFFAVSLALQVAGTIMQVCSSPSNLSNLGKIVQNITNAVTSVVQGSVSIATGVEGKKSTDAKAAAIDSQALMDRTKALIAEIQALQERGTGDLKNILDSFASILSSTAEAMGTYGQGLKAAARA